MSRIAASAGTSHLGFGLLLTLALAAGLLAAPAAPAYTFNPPYTQETGPEQTVFDWSKDACEEIDIPDSAARAFRDAGGRVQLIASHFVTRRMIGPSLDAVKPSCGIVFTSNGDPNPAAFDDFGWISATFTPDGQTVYALVHEEYQGWRYDSRCGTFWATQIQCWVNAVTLAVSTDRGDSYSRATPPAQLVASAPYQYERGTGPFGYFTPSTIVFRPADGYYYVLLRAEPSRAQKEGACVLRTTTPGVPSSWRGWNGTSFSVRFANPYVGAPIPAEHVCEPVAPADVAKMTASLTYSTYLGKFVLIDAIAPEDENGTFQPGVYYTTSADLVHWSQRKLLMRAEVTWTHQCGDQNPIGFPSLLDPNSPSRNFDTIGRQAYLYFTRYNFTYEDGDCYMSFDRDLVRIPIEFYEPPAPDPPPPTSTEPQLPVTAGQGAGEVRAAPEPSPKACSVARNRRKTLARKLRSARRKLARARGRGERHRRRKAVRSLERRLETARESAGVKCGVATPAGSR